MIKTGIVGLGKMGTSHYAILNAHPDVDLVAVCDSSGLILSAIERFGNVKTFKDYKKMIDKCELDCIVISTPTSLHAQILRYAMENNLHVFVEKPFCLLLEEGREMVRLAEQKHLINQIGYHNRFIACFEKTKQLVSDKIIGDVYHFTAESYGQVVLRPKISTWRSKRSEGGGCLYDYASHVIDLVNFVIGCPDQVCGTVLKSIFSQDVADAVYSTFTYNSGMSGQLAVNWSDKTYRKMSTKITIYGKKGKIVTDRQECRVFLWDVDGSDTLHAGWNILYTTDLTKPVGYYLRGEEYSMQIDYFINCIKNKQYDNINSFASGLQTDNLINLLIVDADRRNK
jgi:predicted dehydrogenase